MSVSDIVNHIAIDERTVLGGQPTEAQLSSLRDEGYEVVINLAPTSTAADGSLIDEAAILAEAGLHYHHIPVPWTAPDEEQFARFVAVLDEAGGARTLIHCAINYRVTAFYSSYAMLRRGWTSSEADALIDRIWSSRADVTMSDAWRQFIERTRPSAE